MSECCGNCRHEGQPPCEQNLEELLRREQEDERNRMVGLTVAFFYTIVTIPVAAFITYLPF
jgi:predicted nucleic acid-binding Zn ribbon protein